MKNIIYVVLATLVLASCQKPNKIGFVNNSEVINEYQGKKDVETKFQAKSDAFQKRRDSMVNAYQLELKEAQIKAQRMSQANLQKLSQEIQQKEQLLGQKIQLEQKQIQDAYQAKMEP